jgi:hypothetical protein
MTLSFKSLSRSTNYYKNNNTIKYIVYFISVAISLGYIVNNNLLPLIFFIILSGIIYYLNNNVIISLISSIVIINLLIALKLFDNLEGFKDGKDKKGDEDNGEDKKGEEDNSEEVNKTIQSDKGKKTVHRIKGSDAKDE